jgi:hypothetical protein
MILTRELAEGGIHHLITTGEGSCFPLIAIHAQIQSIRSINWSMIQNMNPIMQKKLIKIGEKKQSKQPTNVSTNLTIQTEAVTLKTLISIS